MAFDTIEVKLNALADCGLKLKDQFGVSDLIDSWGREALDKPGFDLALVCLGMTQEAPPWAPHCDNLWHFDSKCIEGDGSYVSLGRRFVDLTEGALPISELEDHVDHENGEAWLRFEYQGEPVRIDCVVADDWVDPGVFGRFVDLLARSDPNKLFIYLELGGQACIIGCVTRDQYEKLKGLIPKTQPLS